MRAIPRGLVQVRAKSSGATDAVTRSEFPQRRTDDQRGLSASGWIGSQGNDV
jgi:hypothetical protein